MGSLSAENEAQLEDLLSEPYPEDISFAAQLEGDVVILGAGGKMGPTLVQRIARAINEGGSSAKVFAVSRFSDASQRRRLSASGATVVPADLLQESQLAAVPDCPNVIHLVGMKFGSTGKEPLTWAMNAYLPGRVAERFKSSRIVALSTGNVYPLVDPATGGSKETDATGPVGEYAQSCLGRERVLQYFSDKNSTPMCIIRLNYAVEARYGVLLDIARKVHIGEPISLGIGHVNVIWQGDANSICFRALADCKSPSEILNLTGPELLSVRSIAEQFAERLGRTVTFSGQETGRSLLNDASRCHTRFGTPRVSVDNVMDLIVHWLKKGGPTLGKETKFEVSDGRF